MEPRDGIESIDNAVVLKQNIREWFSEENSETVTFMTKPFVDQVSNGMHYNHSLHYIAGDGVTAFDTNTKESNENISSDIDVATKNRVTRDLNTNNTNNNMDDKEVQASSVNQTESKLNTPYMNKPSSDMSTFCKHWLAGLLHHQGALNAICSPTYNCYRRLHIGFAPGKVYWQVFFLSILV